MVSSEWLKKAELFGDLNPSQLKTLFSQSRIEEFPEGKVIFREGEEAPYLYVLVQGLVELVVGADRQIDWMTSRIEKEGAVFGTASLMEPFRYNVTAICLKPSNVLVLDAQYIKRKMKEDPEMGLEVMKKLSSIYFRRLNELRSGVSHLLRTVEHKVP